MYKTMYQYYDAIQPPETLLPRLLAMEPESRRTSTPWRVVGPAACLALAAVAAGLLPPKQAEPASLSQPTHQVIQQTAAPDTADTSAPVDEPTPELTAEGQWPEPTAAPPAENVEVVSSSLLRPYSFEELVADASVIVKAKLTATSDAFQIIPVFGDSPSIFTDYEFTVTENLFGNAREGEALTVRMEGGTAGGTTLLVEGNPAFQAGEEVLLFLYQPNMGSGYNTLGDYYYLLGAGQGAYYADPGNADRYTDSFGNELSLQELMQITGKMNPDDIDPDRFYKEFVENEKANLQSGFITEEEYQALLQEAEQYATIVK